MPFVMQLGISKKFQKEKKESALIMRKQTKIAAVVSAAALLALGASITSFAAAKGTWMMVQNRGEVVKCELPQDVIRCIFSKCS